MVPHGRAGPGGARCAHAGRSAAGRGGELGHPAHRVDPRAVVHLPAALAARPRVGHGAGAGATGVRRAGAVRSPDAAGQGAVRAEPRASQGAGTAGCGGLPVVADRKRRADSRVPAGRERIAAPPPGGWQAAPGVSAAVRRGIRPGPHRARRPRPSARRHADGGGVHRPPRLRAADDGARWQGHRLAAAVAGGGRPAGRTAGRSGEPDWRVPLEIRLYRERDLVGRAAESFWESAIGSR